MPQSFPLPTTPPPAAIVAAAERHHLPVAWAAAVAWRESEWTFTHRTPDDGGSGGTSWGVFQLHDATLEVMPQPWSCMPRRMLFDETIGSNAGALCLRWNLWRALKMRGLVQRDQWGQAQYEQMPSALAQLAPTARIEVLERATAGFTCGPKGLEYWPVLANYYGVKSDKAIIKTQYVADVMRIMEYIEGISQ